MTTDGDRLLRLNLAQVILERLTTAPGGLASMRQLMLDTQRGPSSANLDPDRGGHRHDHIRDADGVFLARIPIDPTGEAAITPDRAAHALGELDDLLDELHAVVLDLAGLHDEWAPRSPKRVSDDDGFARDWCLSCWRIDRTCTPVARRSDGRAYYRGMCKWCGELRAELRLGVGQLPPRSLVEMHLQGKHVSERLLAVHRQPAKRRRKRRGRKAA